MLRFPAFSLLLPVLACLGVFAGLYAYFQPFTVDDAYISLRYADRLLAGKGLTWNDGEFVEGYSNLLWVLVVAGISLLTPLDLEAAMRIGCLFAALGCVWVYLRYVLALKLETGAIACGLAFFTCSLPFAVWALGGMETLLYALLLLCACACTSRWVATAEQRWLGWLGLALGGLALTRPEGIVFAPVYTVALMLLRPQSGKRLLMPLLIAAGICAAQLAFRYFYYGDVLPNTYYAKVAYTHQRVLQGLYYLHTGLGFHAASLVLLCACAWASRQALAAIKDQLVILLLPMIAWAVLVALGGGDIFPAYRHLVPLIVLMGPLLALIFHVTITCFPARKRALLAAFAVTLGFGLLNQWHDYDHRLRVQQETRWMLKCREIGEYLRDHYTEQNPTVAVTAAGIIPYLSKLPAIDLLGLNDPYLIHTPPEWFGTGFIGHELFDMDYIFWRMPEIVIIHDGRDIDWEEYTDIAEEFYYPQPMPLQNPALLHMTTPVLWYRLDFPDVD